MMAGVALMWGSANYFISEALDGGLSASTVTLARVSIGAATLQLFPAARLPVARDAWPRIAVLGATWVALPFTLFPIAQKRIDSSLAGMLIGGLPILTAIVALVWYRQKANRRQALGLVIGLAGVICIAAPAFGHRSSTALGATLVLIAVCSYAVAVNLAVPLQQRYGAIPVVARALLVATALVLPLGLAGIGESRFTGDALASVLPMGLGASGVAFIFFSRVAGRVGAPRAAVVNYFVPLVALFLGVIVRNEDVAALALAGCALVVIGAWLAARK